MRIAFACLALALIGCKPAGPTIRKGVVSCAPGLTETVFALGKGDDLVGVTTSCDYPPGAKTKPQLMDYRVNYESVIKANPALVLMDLTVNNPPEAERLRKLGLDVAAYEPTSVQETADMILDIGKRLGATPKAAQIATALKNAKVDAFRGPRVLFTLGTDGLWVAGTKSLAADCVRRAGGEVVGDAAPKFYQANREEVLHSNPQVIVTTGSASDFTRDAAWAGCEAVRSKKVYHVDSTIFSRAGPRLVQAIRTLIPLLRQ